MSVNTHLALVTAWGEGYGTGHVQRMATLLSILKTKYNIKSSMVCDVPPPFLPHALRQYCVTTLPSDTTFIVRDMRDSSVSQVTALRKVAPVMVLDDLGEGRQAADMALDLLPVLGKKPVPDLSTAPFLYGYNFYHGLQHYGEDTVVKEFDLCVYPGHAVAAEYIEQLVAAIGTHCKLLFLQNNEVFSVVDGHKEKCSFSSLQAVLSSKALLSHFGLMLYEANLCGCELWAVNPTTYHEELSTYMRQTLGIVNLGVYPAIDWQRLRDLTSHLSGKGVATVVPGQVLSRVEVQTERFIGLLLSSL